MRQCELLGLCRSSLYCHPKPVSEADLALMRRIDELHLKHPFLGARRLARMLQREGIEFGRRHVGTLMQLMGVERFDLIQIHNLRDWQVHLETLQEWKASGKVRYIGITTSHGRNHKELEVALESTPFDFVQLSYNIGNRDVERRLLPLAQERGMAVLVNRPFQRGDLFSKVRSKTLPDWAAEIDCSSWAQFFLKYAVSHPAVTCAIPATAKLHHMVDNMGAGVGRLPDARQRERMVRVIESI